VAVNLLVPMSGLSPFISSPPTTPSAVSAVNGLPSSALRVLGRLVGAGNGQALLFSRDGPLRFCSLGVEGRSLRKAARSDLLRSRGVSRRAGDSASDFLTLEEGSGFLRRRIDMKLPRREWFERDAGTVAVVIIVGELIVPRPEPDLRNEPDASVAPWLDGVMADPFVPRFLPNFKLEDIGFTSSELGKSLESTSWAPARLGIPRTGALAAPDRIILGIVVDREMGSSSSLESTKRLWKAGRSSSSSLESAKRLARCAVAFCFDGFEAPDRPKPGTRIGLLVRRMGVDSKELRIELLICVWGGAALLKGRRNAEPVGDKERKLNLLERVGD
jgi:hypothetical protein